MCFIRTPIRPLGSDLGKKRNPLHEEKRKFREPVSHCEDDRTLYDSLLANNNLHRRLHGRYFFIARSYKWLAGGGGSLWYCARYYKIKNMRSIHDVFGYCCNAPVTVAPPILSLLLSTINTAVRMSDTRFNATVIQRGSGITVGQRSLKYCLWWLSDMSLGKPLGVGGWGWPRMSWALVQASLRQQQSSIIMSMTSPNTSK